MTNADLTAASLTQVDLTFATVRCVVLHDAKFSRMQLFHLDFTGGDFSGLQVAAELFAWPSPTVAVVAPRPDGDRREMMKTMTPHLSHLSDNFDGGEAPKALYSVPNGWQCKGNDSPAPATKPDSSAV